MDTTIRDDFADFVDNEELFNSTVALYSSQGGTLVFSGSGTYDKKPHLVENESGGVGYQGHDSFLSLSMSKLTFMTAYFSLKGYYVVITDNVAPKGYTIINSSYNSTVNKIYCELKES